MGLVTLLVSSFMQGCTRDTDAVSANDAEMNRAISEAKVSFGSFLTAADADLNRKIPILQDVLIKIYLFDPGRRDSGEHVWARYMGKHPETDGYFRARLLSQPAHVKIANKGDTLNFSIESVTDWLYVEDGRAVGAYTVRLLRARMSPKERREHDAQYSFSFDK
jgi:uncharacterized protein YegJ (DUF2314 family)